MSPADLAALAAAVDLTDSDIEAAAEKIAGQVQRMAGLWKAQDTPEPVALKYLRAKARQHHVELPPSAGFTQRVNRMADPAWWRRALRKRLRTVEHHAIQQGAVHRRASPYVSEKALRRADADRRRLAALLASLEVLNTNTGEVIPLDDVIKGSQANPANRRAALMVRIKGIEARARTKGHEALFLTITAPSRMHARHHTGQANTEHDGSCPRQVQTYLHGVWRRAMRSLQRQGLAAYGLRTVEPHHDGCPHWHVLVFAPAEQTGDILQTLRACALADSPDEPGAAEHRFKVERIDPAKGSALAYVAKYVSKSIDGEGLDSDTESDTSGADTARRVVAWARRWGIRQFQFFGLPPITPMRELYRHSGEGLGSPALTEAHQACKANDHAAYLGACEAHGIDFGVRYVDRPSTRYADELARAIRGLNARAADLLAPLELTTRTETWCIQPRQVRADVAVCLPWTRFNNCAQSIESSTCEGLRDLGQAGAAGNRSTRRPGAPT
ncbi:replication endonuclease, partial [Pseudaquabacterium pictum]|uniref:replication endonuclease n=1 Tax=Pseudaquabacterium pictum TaxID=2315236 RepID=UPI0010F4C16A